VTFVTTNSSLSVADLQRTLRFAPFSPPPSLDSTGFSGAAGHWPHELPRDLQQCCGWSLGLRARFGGNVTRALKNDEALLRSRWRSCFVGKAGTPQAPALLFFAIGRVGTVHQRLSR